MPEGVEEQWKLFLDEHADEINTSILESFEEQAGLLDVLDGTHAAWNDEHLGILIVLTEDEAEILATESDRISDGIARHAAYRDYIGRLVEEIVQRAVSNRYLGEDL
jgi:hypothetical protein